MMLEFSPLARLDLLSILQFIAADKPHAAKRFVQELDNRCQLLAQFPNLGTLRDDLLPSLRVFVFRGYGIYFRVLEHIVRVERVLSPGVDVVPEQFD